MFLRWMSLIAVAAGVVGWLSVTRADNCPWGGAGYDCGGPGQVGCCMDFADQEDCVRRTSCECIGDQIFPPLWGLCNQTSVTPFPASERRHFHLRTTLGVATCKLQCEEMQPCYDVYTCSPPMPGEVCWNDQDCKRSKYPLFLEGRVPWRDSYTYCGPVAP